MITLDPYSQFLQRSAAGLMGSGAQPLVLPGTNGARPEWAAGWNQILLVDGMGPSSLYAFTNSAVPSIVRERLDHLTAGVSKLVTGGGAPLRVVAIVGTDQFDGSNRRAVTRISPSTYYPGLRPVVWTADLRTGELSTGGLMGMPDGAEAVRAALQGQVLAPGPADRAISLGLVPGGTTPWVTYSLIAINTAIFLWVFLTGRIDTSSYPVDYGALVPSRILDGQWWRLLSAMFLHGGVVHILSNMVSLYAVGTLAERLFGHVRYLLLYTGAGLAGSLASLAYSEWVTHSNTPGVGASGAIFGITGALIALRFIDWSPLPARLRRYISGSVFTVVLINLAILIFVPYVDNAAHVGGLLGGAALAFLLAPGMPAGPQEAEG